MRFSVERRRPVETQLPMAEICGNLLHKPFREPQFGVRDMKAPKQSMLKVVGLVCLVSVAAINADPFMGDYKGTYHPDNVQVMIHRALAAPSGETSPNATRRLSDFGVLLTSLPSMLNPIRRPVWFSTIFG